MRRGTANAVVDIVLGVLFVPSLVSALVLFFVLPSGGGRGGGDAFLSVERSTWATLHDYAGLLFIAFRSSTWPSITGTCGTSTGTLEDRAAAHRREISRRFIDRAADASVQAPSRPGRASV